MKEFTELNSNQEVMKYFPKILSKKEVVKLMKNLQLHLIENGFTYYATEVLDTKEFIGMIGLACQNYKSIYTPAIDIGWRLKKSAWGKGYATEGAKRCLQFGFNELKIEKIISLCTLNNRKSEHVMKKIGMIRKGIFNHPELVDYPDYKAHLCYEIRRNS